ncbi:MAG: hypothetical protein U1G07_19780 [Verrucomicrobiota bacterium]
MMLQRITPHLIVAALFTAAIPPGTTAAEPRKPTVSVAATESQIPSWQPAMGQGSLK